MAAIASREQVQDTQTPSSLARSATWQLLGRLAFPTPLAFGPYTYGLTEALTAFQRQQHLRETGELDEPTISRLTSLAREQAPDRRPAPVQGAPRTARRLRGFVMHADGPPVRDARVIVERVLVRTRGTFGTPTTDEGGYFECEDGFSSSGGAARPLSLAVRVSSGTASTEHQIAWTAHQDGDAWVDLVLDDLDALDTSLYQRLVALVQPFEPTLDLTTYSADELARAAIDWGVPRSLLAYLADGVRRARASKRLASQGRSRRPAGLRDSTRSSSLLNDPLVDAAMFCVAYGVGEGQLSEADARSGAVADFLESAAAKWLGPRGLADRAAAIADLTRDAGVESAFHADETWSSRATASLTALWPVPNDQAVSVASWMIGRDDSFVPLEVPTELAGSVTASAWARFRSVWALAPVVDAPDVLRQLVAQAPQTGALDTWVAGLTEDDLVKVAQWASKTPGTGGPAEAGSRGWARGVVDQVERLYPAAAFRARVGRATTGPLSSKVARAALAANPDYDPRTSNPRKLVAGFAGTEAEKVDLLREFESVRSLYAVEPSYAFVSALRARGIDGAAAISRMSLSRWMAFQSNPPTGSAAVSAGGSK